MNTNYWAGVTMFSVMLILLIGALFGVFTGLTAVAVAYMSGEGSLGIVGAVIAGISLGGLGVSYLWFTEPV